MGAMNRHPSCSYTWYQTTQASKKISSAFASLMTANTHLEEVLLAEFNEEDSGDSTKQMVQCLHESVDDFRSARLLIAASIETSQANPDDFVEARENLAPVEIAERWDGTLLTNSKKDVERIAAEIKNDRLATARRFVDEIESLIELYKPVIEAFEEAGHVAGEGRLKDALASNEIPVQRSFGRLLSETMQFMNDYLIDSLVATQVSLDQRRHPALIAAK